jgi:hypothetical protein
VRLGEVIRFLVLKLIHQDSNHRFNIDVVFMTNYFVSVKQRPHRQRCVLDDRLREISKSNRFSISEVLIRVGYACVFIWLSTHTYINTCVL